MKKMKKALSILLSVIFVLSCCSMGAVGFAAQQTLDYSSLAKGFFKKSGQNVSTTTVDVGNQVSFTMPALNIVGDMSRYTVTNTSGDYKYNDSQEKPIRCLAYDHKVLAGDDHLRSIQNAYNTFSTIVQSKLDAAKRVNPLTVPTPDKLIDEIVEQVKQTKATDGSLLFFDGYQYFVDATGKIVSRTANKTYTANVVKGKVEVTYNKYDKNGTVVGTTTLPKEQGISAKMGMGTLATSTVAANRVKNGNISTKTLWDLANVESVIQYFFGNCITVNSGNWYHNFILEIKTDINYVLENYMPTDVSIYDNTYTYNMGRTYDDSGTEASYYFAGRSETTPAPVLDHKGTQLTNLTSSIDAEIKDYLEPDVNGNRKIDRMDDVDLRTIWSSTGADTLKAHYELFQSVSNAALKNFFGVRAYEYINLITQLRPSSGDPYLPTRHSDKYDTDYTITNANCTAIVDSVDNLFTNQSVARVLSPLMPMLTSSLDPTSTIGGLLGNLHIDETSGTTLNEIIQTLVPQVLFQDSIINLIVGKVYPLVSNLLDGMLTDQFLNDKLGHLTGSDGLDNIISKLITSIAGADNGGWQALIYAALVNKRIALYPSAFAYSMDYYGFDTEYPVIYNTFKDKGAGPGKGGNTTTKAGDFNLNDFNVTGTEHFNDYKNNLLATEFDGWCKNRWGDINFDLLDGAWGINGDRDRFMRAITVALTPIAPLLACLLGNQSLNLKLLELNILVSIDIGLELKDLDLYNTILLPLFEALGLNEINDLPGIEFKDKLKTGPEFRNLASGIIDTSNAGNKIETFLTQGLLNPLLKWLFDIVLKNPLQAVANLLPNVVLFLDSGFLWCAVDGLAIDLNIKIGSIRSFSVYTLEVGSLLNGKLDMLKSLGGILKLINLSAKTDDPIIGYAMEGDTTKQVLAPNGPKWNDEMGRDSGGVPYKYSSRYTKAVTEAYVDAQYVTNGRLNSSFVTVDSNGKITRNGVMYSENTTGNLVKISGKDAFGDILYENLVQTDDDNVGYTNGTAIQKDGNTDAGFVTKVFKCWAYEHTEGATTTVRYAFNTNGLTPQELATAYETYNITYNKVPIALPPIMDYKLMDCGTVEVTTSGRDVGVPVNPFYMQATKTYEIFNPPSGVTTIDRWYSQGRYQVRLDDAGRGKVLIFLLRYLLSALNYRDYTVVRNDQGNVVSSGYENNAPFIGMILKGDALTNTLIGDLSVGTLIDNITLGPDAVICTLFELLSPRFPNETSDLSRYDIEATLAQGQVVAGHKEAGKTDYYKYSMSDADYEYDTLNASCVKYNDYLYGTTTLYSEYWTREDSKYLTDNLDNIIKDIGAMTAEKGDSPGLGIDLSNGLGGVLNDLIGGYINNGIVSMIGGALYPMLDGLLNGALKGVLGAALGADYSKTAVIQALRYTFQTTNVPAAKSLQAQIEAGEPNYTKQSFYKESGEPLDWGLGDTAAEKQLRGNKTKLDMLLKDLSALFSPFAIIFRFLFTGEDLTVLRDVDEDGTIHFGTGLLNIAGYEGYHYAWIPLMRAFGAEQNLLSYRDYFEKCYCPTSYTGFATKQVAGNVNTVEYLLKPLITFANNLLANPIQVLFGLIPNLLFYLTIGAFSDTINNLIQPIYVLLDEVTPIVDAIPLVNSLIANLDIKGMKLPLALPLDLDFNSLINSILGGLLGDLLKFDIRPKKNVVGKTLQSVTQDFVTAPATLDAMAGIGKPAVITESAYNSLGLTDQEEQLKYQKLYRVRRDSSGRAVVDNDEASETYGQILYDEVIDAATNEAVYGRYDENGQLYSNSGASYTDCVIKVEAKNTPVYEVESYDASGMPVYSPDYERQVNTPMKDSSGNIYYEDSEFNPNTRVCWTPINDYDYTQPIAGSKKPLQKSADYYAWGTLRISLPYIDLNTLTYGTLKFQRTNQFSQPKYVFLDSNGGSDLITVVVRLVLKVLALKDNTTNIVHWLDSTAQLAKDEEELLTDILTSVIDLFKQYKIIDRVLQVLIGVIKIIVPVADQLAEKFRDPKCEYNVQSLVKSISAGISGGDLSVVTKAVSNVISAGPEKDPDADSGTGEKLSIFAKIIAALKRFFENIKKFFQSLVKR